MRNQRMRNQRTYKGSTPCPCDDCTHHDYCQKTHMSCKVSRYWETMGNVLMKKEIPVDRTPDIRLVFRNSNKGNIT